MARFVASFVLCLPLFACGDVPPSIVSHDGPVSRLDGERWTTADEPTSLVDNASARLADVVTSNDVGRSFGVADDRIPYPDTFWPFDQNGIDARWNEGESSPLEKYMQTFAPSQLAKAKAWEKKHHGEEVHGVEPWFGHCNGWTASAMLHSPLQHEVSVRGTSRGAEVCSPGDGDCTTFQIGDINGLLAEVNLQAEAKFIGSRCDLDASKIKRDDAGRVLTKGCKGVNAGAFVIVLAERLKNQRLPLAINAQTSSTTKEIWNQPAFRYSVNAFEPLALQEALDRIGSSASGYKYNSAARGFAFVDVSLSWVSETDGPNMRVVSGETTARETRVTIVLELDRDATDPDATIIGGEYVEVASAGTDRLTNAPYLWIAEGGASGNEGRNPYLDAAIVEQLAAFAQ